MATIPATQPIPTDSNSTTTWADLGIEPTETEQQVDVEPPNATHELHPLCHSIQHLQDQSDHHGDMAIGSRERPDQDTLPRQIYNLIESTNTQTRTWAQLMAKHTASNKAHTLVAKRIRDQRTLQQQPRPKRHRYHLRVQPSTFHQPSTLSTTPTPTLPI